MLPRATKIRHFSISHIPSEAALWRNTISIHFRKCYAYTSCSISNNLMRQRKLFLRKLNTFSNIKHFVKIGSMQNYEQLLYGTPSIFMRHASWFESIFFILNVDSPARSFLLVRPTGVRRATKEVRAASRVVHLFSLEAMKRSHVMSPHLPPQSSIRLYLKSIESILP